MKKRSIRKLSGAIGALLISVFAASCGSNSQDTGGAASDTADTAAASQNELVFTENKVGSYDGYDYELWKDTGDTTFTVKSGGTFSCKWSDINNALFRRGQKFDCTKTYDEIGNMSINYGVDYRPDGNSYMCVYGWTRDPLVEFYIVQSWGTWRPPGAPMSLGRVVIDGDTYDIYKTIRVNQPSIDGTKTFDQYWSVRDVKPESSDDRIEGTISITKHFDAWAECGLELGKMYETALTIEGYQSNGEADVYKNELIIEDTYTKAEDLDLTVNGAVKKAEKKSSDTEQTSEGPVMFKSDFESETDGWNGRGSAQVSLTDEFSDEGEKSLYVSGRSENWNGAAINLDSGIFSPGSVCSFGARAMQNSGDTAQIKLTLQYDTDITHYDQVAMASAASGEWVTLENNEFIIPDGAQNLILYVESPDSLCDLYIDNAYAGVTDGSAVPAADSSETLAKSEVEHHDPVAVPNNADISWIDTSKPMVAIAFDDGASAVKKTDPAYRIIDTMADNGFHATFFYVSDWIKTEAQVKYAHEKGMEIANHTKTHPYLSKCEPDTIRSEVETADKRLKEIIGTEPSKLLRLPYLDCNETVKNVLYDTPLISCSVDTKDWSGKTKDEIVDTLKKAKENGTLKNAIVLCHENYETTADAMAEIVPWLKSEGWQVVTISELFAANDKEMMGGTIYTKVQ